MEKQKDTEMENEVKQGFSGTGIELRKNRYVVHSRGST